MTACRRVPRRWAVGLRRQHPRFKASGPPVVTSRIPGTSGFASMTPQTSPPSRSPISSRPELEDVAGWLLKFARRNEHTRRLQL